MTRLVCATCGAKSDRPCICWACFDRGTDSAAESGSVSQPLPHNATYATDPDAFTDAWYRRRAAAYADDARKIVASLREYEDVHPADAPCLMPLLDSLPNAYWHDFPADAAGETGSANA